MGEKLNRRKFIKKATVRASDVTLFLQFLTSYKQNKSD